ncbi:hypothetical protein K469DRAFT_114108 [Zopfia rhizophila CBS 207.26]|uniref:Uncharacterized protein n=1 Tax=Zopfia rhizophila CBS 207.26 TaxID=1314779 RepID=A0A6A6ECA8_9PEZI|nr:hypothetical protein K469DRAFT_114108 [Zopfia rhizophila CBS 207.26]
MVTVNMEVVNFFQPRVPARSLPLSQPPKPPVPHKEKEKEEAAFAQPNNQRVSKVDNRGLVAPGGNEEDNSEFPMEQLLLPKLPTDTAAAMPSTDEQVLNDHGKPSDKAEPTPPHQVQNRGSGSTQENPIAIDKDDNDEMQSIFGDIGCINAERDAKPRKNSPFDSTTPRLQAPLHPPNLLNPGEPERAPSSARHGLPLSPNDLPVQSLDEAELNPDRIAQNAREKSAPEILPSISLFILTRSTT